MNSLAVIALSFLLASGLVYAVAEIKTASARRLRDRLDKLTGRFAPLPSPSATAAEDAPRPDALPTVSRWLGGSDLEKRLRLAMLRADWRLRPAEWVALCLVVPLFTALVGLLATHRPLFGLLFGLLGLLLPLGLLQARQAARLSRFDGQLSDALMLLTASLRAGHSFSQAVQTVAAELPPPLSAEFAWVAGETGLGVPLETALGRMLERVPSPDMDLVATAILIQLPLGGNLAEVLESIADTIRERVRLSGEVRTLTAEGKLSAIILIVLSPALALLLSLRDPNYFQPLLDSPSGHWLIGGAIAGQIIGGYVISRMVKLEV